MSPDAVFHLLETYGYFILFPISIIEGPIITIIAGFLVSLKIFNPLLVYAVVVLGDVVGDLGCYLLGRLGGAPAALRYGKWLGVTPEKLERAEKLFTEHRKKAVALSKFVHGIGFTGLIAAGILRIPYRKLFLVGLVLSMLQSACLLALGFFFGAAYRNFDTYIGYFAIGASCVAVIGISGYLIWRRGKRKRTEV